jgi:nucleoside diphosphate kinase
VHRDDLTPAVPDWSYVLITPDGVVGGSLDGVVQRLRWHGLRPGACRLIDLTVDTMQEVYLESSWQISNPGHADVTFSWGMHSELYGLAPACLVMLTPRSGPACEAMLRCKGHTRPELAARDTIRWAGENVIFNLVHCPDDASSAVRELTVMVGADAAAQLISIARSSNPDVAQLVGVRTLVGCLPAFSGWAAISFVAIANKLRRRALMSLALALRDSPDALDVLAGAQRSLAAELEAITAAPTSVARMRFARRVSPSLHRSLAAAAEELGNEVMLSALAALADLYRLDGARDLDGVLALSQCGVYISPLERVILESHCYAFRPSRELADLYPVDSSLVLS